MQRKELTLLITILIYSGSSVAIEREELWTVCGNSWKSEWKFIEDIETYHGKEIEITAASSKMVVKKGKELLELEGDIQVLQEDMILRSNNALYDGEQDSFVAIGDVRVQDSSYAIRGSNANMKLKDSKGTISDAEYRLLDEHLRGEAVELELLGKGEVELSKAAFTSCNPGSDDWYLRASEINLNDPENSGTAKHVRIEFMGVPFFYSPYLSFPLGRRKSGLLLPTTGTTENTGSDISLPIYLNLAQNYDLTLTPRSMEKRGTQINSEFRYMTENSRGVLHNEYLKYDMQTLEQRDAYYYRHNGTLATNWRLNLDLKYVSDEEYYNDLKDGIGNVSQTHLESKGEFSYQADSWKSAIKYQSFLPLLGSSQQYQRQPQINFSGKWPLFAGFNLGIESELVRLDKETGKIAERRNYEPTLGWELRGMPGYFETKIKHALTRYQKTDQDLNTEEQQEIERSSFSAKGALYFDRFFEFFDKQYVQTLEPEIYYLYVPYVDQTEIDVFDTSSPEFNYSALSRDDRFTGIDRWGDTRQVTGALTTKFIDEKSGRELFSASIGQIHYLDSRRVTLGKTEVIDETLKTDLAAQIKAEPNNYTRFKSDLVWNIEEDRLEIGNGQLDLRADTKRVLRINYRYRHLTQRQLDVSLYWPISERWRVMARGFHDIEEDMTMEKMAGIEYESCCWSVRMLQKRNYLNSGITTPATTDAPLEENVSFWFQFELKGLGNFGNKADNFIEKDLLGDRLTR